MPRHQLTTQCDSEKLESFLRGRLSSSETEILELHLTECASCAAQLQRAAEQSLSWNEAQSLLAADEFDSPQQSAAISSLVNDDSESMTKQQTADVLSREIRGWLDATDDPRSMGRFAGYEIVGIVGHGGMGIVLKGFEASLNRYVAIKILAPRLATNGSARKRFAREAQAAAAVRHENVIAIHRVDEWHGLPFLVMPYAGGISLQKRIDSDGPLSLEQTLRIGIQIASGLAAAHAQGLVHRDIKPANILVEQGVERVTITDFGLARAADDATLTRTGVIAGTPEYMSPEQAEAKPVDARSDLFSLGSVLYAMAAGRPPFTGSSSFEILKQIINDPARRLRDLQPSVPDWFERIVNQLHSKSPSDRPSSANEVAELLQACLAHLQSPTSAALPESLTATANSDRNHHRPWIARLASAAAFGLILLLASVIIVLETNKGTLTIQCEADDVPIRIMQGNATVSQLTVSKEEKSIRIAAGQYEIVVDGGADGIAIKEGGNIELRRGETEVVRITYSENKGTSTPASTAIKAFNPPLERIDNLPEDTEVHVVGCYGTTNRGSVTVKVAKTGKPQVVVLTSYFSSDWNLEVAPDADVRAVVLSGYFNQQFSNVAPRNIPTRTLTYFPIWDDITQQEKQDRHSQCFYVWSPLSKDFGKMQSVIEGVTGRSITTFQGIYDAKSFSIDGTRGAEEARVAARWQSLVDRSNRDSDVFRKVLSKLESFQNDYHSGLKPKQLKEMMRLMDDYEKTLPPKEDRTSLATPGDSAFSDRAWQKTTEYVAPDFNRFFPDNKEGSQALEALWNSPDRDSCSDEDILKTFREGFRNTTLHRMPLLRWLGNRYIWGQSTQNPDAIELMYHAADFRGENADPSGARHAAVYFGLSVTQPKTPAILRTLAELAMRVDDPNDLDRIAWGCNDQRAELLEYLKPFETSDDEVIRKKADVCRRIFEGNWRHSRGQPSGRRSRPKPSTEIGFLSSGRF